MANYSDAFNRANGTVSSATWYSTSTDFPTILSNAVVDDQVGNSYTCTYRSALASGRSTSQIQLTTKGTSSPMGGPCIAMNIATPAPVDANNRWNAYASTPFYRFVAKTAGYQLQKKQDGVSTFTDVGSQYTTTPTNGQVLKIEYDENTGVLNGYINGILRCTYTDPTPITGGRYSGFAINFGTTLDTWVADDLAAAPVASFTKNVASGVSPLTVNFTDTSTGTPTSWSWAFGDGATSTSQNPSHQFANAGTYSVVLTATNAGGSDASVAQTVTVSSPVGSGRVKYWNGSLWVSKPLKARLAGVWVDKTASLKVWDGLNWVAPAGAGTDPPEPTTGSLLHSTAGFAGFQNSGDIALPGVHGAPLLLTAGDVAGIARSNDGGEYWWACNSYIQTVSARKALSGIHWSKYRSGVAWAYSHGGIAKSTNYGVTFSITGQAANNPETGGSDQPRQTGRMILEGANTTVYVGTLNGIYRSTDQGVTFTQWALAGTKVTGITEDPVDNSLIYVSTVAHTAAQSNPGVYAINVSTGASSRYALGDAQDLVAIDVSGVTHLYVAAGLQGVRRWIRPNQTSGAHSAILAGPSWTNITGVLPVGNGTTITGTELASSTNTQVVVASATGLTTSSVCAIGKDAFDISSISGTTLNGAWLAPTGSSYAAGMAFVEKANGGSPGRWGAVDAVYSGGNVIIMIGFWDEGSLEIDGPLGTGVANKFKTVWRATNGLSNPPTWVDDSSNYVQLGLVGATSINYYSWVYDPYMRLCGSAGDVAQIRIDPSNPEIVYSIGRNVPSKRVSANPTVWRPAGRGHNGWIGHEVSSDPSDPTRVLTSAVDWGSIASNTRFETGTPITYSIPTNAAYAVKVGSNGKGYLGAANRDNSTPNGEAGDVLENDDPWATGSTWVSTNMPSGLGRCIGVEMTTEGATRRLVAFINPNSGATDPQAGFWYKNGTGAWTRCATGSGTFVKDTVVVGGASVQIQVSPTAPETLYALVYWDGLWRSTNYGLTWTRIWAKSTNRNNKTQRALTVDPVVPNRIAIAIGLEMWIITNANNGTLNANGTTASGTIAAAGPNNLNGVQSVAARPDGRLFAMTTGPADTRMHTSTNWSTFSAINVGKLGEVVRGVFGMHATSDRIYVVADGEGLVVVNPPV